MQDKQPPATGYLSTRAALSASTFSCSYTPTSVGEAVVQL